MLKTHSLSKFITCLILLISITPTSNAAGLKAGMSAPGFELKSLQGEQVSLKSLQDKGLVMLVFWAPECVYCYMHIQDFNELHNKYNNKGLTVAAINFHGEYEEEVKDYVETNNIVYLMLTDQLKNIDVAESYKVFATPTIVLISKKGKILYYGHKVPDVGKLLK